MAEDGLPPGFRTLDMPQSLVEAAREEVEDWMQTTQWEMELQHSFYSSRRGRLNRKPGPERLPGCFKLMEAVNEAFGISDCDTERVQVAVRRYLTENGTRSLEPHVDDRRMFGEPVMSVVLRLDSPGDGLNLWPLGRRPSEGEAFAVAERPGVAVCLQGSARYEHVHAVPPVTGTRISMTWRWFKPEYYQELLGQGGGA